MNLELVTRSNFKEAIRIQNIIFPLEDGTVNILTSLDRELFIKRTGIAYPGEDATYYLVVADNEYVGITGYYTYYNKKDEAWLGWFGILPDKRERGYGESALKMTIDLVRSLGFSTFRLYTDSVDNAKAVELYKKLGFVGEQYSAEELGFDCWIYSISLCGNIVTPWNNKNLNLSHQTELEQISKNKLSEIIKIYENSEIR